MKKYNKILQKMIDFDDITKENIKKHNPIRHKFLIIHEEY